MADTGPADVIVEVEEEAPLSNYKDDEENTGSDGDSSSNTNDNQAPQDSHRRKYTVDEITNAIVTGNLEAMRDWLSSLPQGDERKDELNTVKYKDKWIYYSEYDHTVLHIAAKNNQVAIAKELLQEGADPNIKSSTGSNALHSACIASHDVNITEMVELLIERGCNIDETNGIQQTPLHYAAENHHTTAVRMLLQKGADPNKKDMFGCNALHLACSAPSHVDITEAVELLIENNCRVNELDEYGNQPIHYAALKGNNDVFDILVKKHGEIDSKLLKYALYGGSKYIVKQLIKTPKWPALMRRTFEISDKITTPFREMVKKMPDVAEEILNKCTMNDPDYPNPDEDDIDYSVAFCYEFLEDARDKEQSSADGNEDRQCEFDYKSIVFKDYEGKKKKDRQNYLTSWGPNGFEKANHLLAIMVQYKRLNLLNHPLVRSLLHHKWNKFGLLWYIINLLTYLVFLVSLTTFTLIIENPKNQACLSVSVNMSSNYSENYCGISTSRVSFIYISALVVIILSLCRLLLEVMQFKIQLLRYLYDWNNWMETFLYNCSIISVFVFHNDCLCPSTWQWQIGVVAVFLGWMNLVVFISKFPVLGIYVLMFIKIFKTFLKTLLLSILLIVSFGLTFYLTFTQPEILRSPFSTPARSLLKIVTMTTGELDFDSIFRQDPAGGSDDAEEVPFPPISYMLWIVFIIIMPILLNNMLVGLAIDDIGAIQKDAELEKLALQVEHVLTVEELLPRKLRRRYTCGYKRVFPNRKLPLSSGWWKDNDSRTEGFRMLRRLIIKKIQFFFWGGRRYDTLESIKKVLTAKEDESMNEQKKSENLQEKTDKLLLAVNNLKTSVTEQVVDSKTAVNEESEKVEKLLHEVADLKVSLNDEMEKTQERNDKVLQEVGDLKICLHDEIEKAQVKNDEVIQVLQRSFHGELETAQRMNEKLVREVGDLKISLHEEMQKAQNSVDEMKQLLRQIVPKQGGTEVQ